jgi:hypothetical protein
MSLRWLEDYVECSLEVSNERFAQDRAASKRLTRRGARLLFLAYEFPPTKTSGSIRAYETAKWLTRKGWEVTVVTPNQCLWGGTDGAEEFYDELSRQAIRCIRTGHRWRWLVASQREQNKHFAAWALSGVGRWIAAFLGIERETGWVRDAERACAGLVPDDVDLILASGPPFVSFELARRLAHRLDRRCLLDYRDPWTRKSAYEAASHPFSFAPEPRGELDADEFGKCRPNPI